MKHPQYPGLPTSKWMKRLTIGSETETAKIIIHSLLWVNYCNTKYIH